MRIDRRATQFVFAGIVRVEGRPPDIRLLADILDRDRRISALRDQGDERVLQQGARPRDAPVDHARHVCPFDFHGHSRLACAVPDTR